MKKIFKGFSLFLIPLILLSLFTLSASAANHVKKIDIDVMLCRNGDAVITQIWSGDFDEGTECYYPFSLKDGISITDFTVTDGERHYETLSDWDTDGSLSQKAYKCGLNRLSSSEVEVCWGISKYGSRSFTVQYTVKALAASYRESDGFNFRFIDDEMNTGPTEARLCIRTQDQVPLTDSNANIWAFGFDGGIRFQSDGTILAETDSRLRSNNHMTVMVELEKGILSPDRSSDKSFEEVKEKAFDGSDYEEEEFDPLLFLIIFLSIFLIIFAILLSVLICFIIRKIKLKKFEQETDYYREVPNEGNINISYFLAKNFKFCEEGAILGARLLQLIIGGNIETVTETKIGFMGKEKKSHSFRLAKPVEEGGDPLNRCLYEILRKAAGSDGILQEKELSRYATAHYESIRSFLDSCEASGSIGLQNKGAYLKPHFNRLNAMSDNGKKELREVIGLRKFLLDFSLIAEREVKEISIWKDYLVYALLFGIADKTARELKEIYPDSLPEIQELETGTIFAGHIYRTMFTSMRAAEFEVEAARTAGSGGHASFGGGGGFSGGGSGGGTR